MTRLGLGLGLGFIGANLSKSIATYYADQHLQGCVVCVCVGGGVQVYVSGMCVDVCVCKCVCGMCVDV